MVQPSLSISLCVPTEYCSLPQDEGTAPTSGADDFQILLYYDAAKDLCYPFKYLGEGGNANRFTLEKLCMRNCSAKAEEIYPSKACHFKKALGECFGTYLRYFYDPIHEKCKKFHWTGCVGNGNRFIDHQACNATCAGIHVGLPFAAITASTLLGRLSTRCWIIAAGTCFHSATRALVRSSSVLDVIHLSANECG
uniref:BPTI/Kunitz inhibitor domain-containing protein n=1 Tax=Oncorhynchus mykiss TaxID=8022 RepID=A0A8C7SXM7_ONCMY